MLGSLGKAKVVVQEAWLRWARTNESVDMPAAYLTRIVTRLCLDQLKSASVRCETYMIAMERLSPLERAAFLLHDVFDVALTEIAATLGRTPAAMRQIAARARKMRDRASEHLDRSAALRSSPTRRVTDCLMLTIR